MRNEYKINIPQYLYSREQVFTYDVVLLVLLGMHKNKHGLKSVLGGTKYRIIKLFFTHFGVLPSSNNK